jgi:hypothetical protein
MGGGTYQSDQVEGRGCARGRRDGHRERERESGHGSQRASRIRLCKGPGSQPSEWFSVLCSWCHYPLRRSEPPPSMYLSCTTFHVPPPSVGHADLLPPSIHSCMYVCMYVCMCAPALANVALTTTCNNGRPDLLQSESCCRDSQTSSLMLIATLRTLKIRS